MIKFWLINKTGKYQSLQYKKLIKFRKQNPLPSLQENYANEVGQVIASRENNRSKRRKLRCEKSKAKKSK